ncbi:MAG: hypothetical protein ACTHK8_10945 [Ginsengibacter sp.]|jgi:hypothetical protein
MGKYMTFMFDAAALKRLMDQNPDYVLVNVGYRLIPDPENPEKQVAQLTVDAEGCTEGKGMDAVIDTVGGCPVPPCVPL